MTSQLEKSIDRELRPLAETHRSASATELQSALNETGYLFVRGLMPSDMVLHVRAAVLELCNSAGWLDPCVDMMDGLSSPNMVPLTEGMPEYSAVYRRILKLPAFHGFPTHPALIEVMRKVLGGASAADVLVHPRRIGRITFPNLTSATTPPHQDYHYIRGTTETYTCWMPLGDCPFELGGLAVWPGSHKLGFLEHSVCDPAAVGGRAVPVDEDVPWHASPFQAGDALFFHSHTIHKALPNLSGTRLRISTDNRYQRAQDGIDPSSLRPHADLY